MKKSSSGLQHKAAHNPRTAAIKVLSEVLNSGTDTQLALNEALSSMELMPTDKRLLTELVYGTLRNYLRLERFIFSFLAKPEKLPEEMRLTLILALYEILLLRIPPHAAINQAVQHIHNRFGQGLAKVANGTLRAAQRSRKTFFALEETEPQTALELADRYSVPLFLAELWLNQYGLEETILLLKASLEQAPTGIRINKTRPNWQGIRAELLHTAEEIEGNNKKHSPMATPIVIAVEADEEKTHKEEETDIQIINECCLAFASRPPWQLRTLEKDGYITRQSAASYEALFALEPASWPLPIWDACAGRGGKTLALLESDIAVSLSTDLSAKRINALNSEFQRLFPQTTDAQQPALPDIQTISALDLNTNDSLNSFGTILIDAPCSGFGTLARRPEIRLRRTPQDIDTLIATQNQLLEVSWKNLLPGGLIIYMTCTRNQLENEAQIRAFLDRHPDAVCEQEFSTPAASPLKEFFYATKIRKK